MDNFTKPTTFPGSLVWDLRDYMMANLPDVNQVLLRPLNPTDVSSLVGIVAKDWEPTAGRDSYETGQDYPLLTTYSIEVWGWIKHLKEEEGLQQHGILARNIRRMLAGDAGLRAMLVLNVDDYATGVERVQRVRLVGQKFHSNEIKGSHIYLSISTLNIETEST